MREFSLDLDKITPKKLFCKKVFVSTCLHCFNAATPLPVPYPGLVNISGKHKYQYLILASLILVACYRYIMLFVLVQFINENEYGFWESFHKYINVSNFNLVCLLPIYFHSPALWNRKRGHIYFMKPCAWDIFVSLNWTWSGEIIDLKFSSWI